MSTIKISNVSKNFRNIQALQNVNLTFESAKIYGLLGRNGAGKTTLLNIICNRIFPDQGEVLLDGKPIRENDQLLGKIYMMSEHNLYPDNFRVADVFKWTKEFYGDFDDNYCQFLCQQFGLDNKKKIRGLSTGYKSIYKMIVALSLTIPFILLDEPVLGLDANHRDMFYKALLQTYSDKPRTFIISTHLIEEVSDIIEDVVIIKKGQIITNQSCAELLQTGYTATGSIAAIDRFIEQKQVISTDVLGGLKSAYIIGQAEKVQVPEGIEISKLDLQKLFIQLTNA
ncbi:MAG: ATP-binding cassette domain-containing protein [Bacillota bacterium]